MNNPMIVKSNALIEAGHRLSLAEQRLVLIAISQMRRDETPDSRAWYSVNAADLAAAAGVSVDGVYAELADSVERLWQREIVIRGGTNGDQKNVKGKSVMKARWVQSVEYLDAEGRVNLMFSELVVPYLAQLQAQFTQYELRHVAPMHSRFGPRLYELLVQWRSAGERTLELDWLQSHWGTKYDRIFELKRRAIQPAIDDINTHSDLTVSVSYGKTGRRVTHATFKFSKQKRKRKTPKPQASKPSAATPEAAADRRGQTDFQTAAEAALANLRANLDSHEG